MQSFDAAEESVGLSTLGNTCYASKRGRFRGLFYTTADEFVCWALCRRCADQKFMRNIIFLGKPDRKQISLFQCGSQVGRYATPRHATRCLTTWEIASMPARKELVRAPDEKEKCRILKKNDRKVRSVLRSTSWSQLGLKKDFCVSQF